MDNRIKLTRDILEKNGFYWGNTANEQDAYGSSYCDVPMFAPEKTWVFDDGDVNIKIRFRDEDANGIMVDDLHTGYIFLDDLDSNRSIEFYFNDEIYVDEFKSLCRLLNNEQLDAYLNAFVVE